MSDAKLNLTDAEKIPIEPADSIENWGATLIVAPHPDDESLGCGGAIALLRQAQIDVDILVLSDGTLSHPNSKKFPPPKLRDLREREMLAAAKILGVDKNRVEFFRYPDRNVPNEDAKDFQSAVKCCRDYLNRKNPQTILVPWRRDPHPDHRAAFQIISAAKNKNQTIYEYPIWLYELAQSADAPLKSEAAAFRLDIAETAAKKQRAIRAHRSQTTDLIDDDADGFRLSEEVLRHFAVGYEIYFKEVL